MKTRMEELDRKISNTLSNWQMPKGKGKETVKEELLSAIRTTNKGKVISLEKWHWVAAACLAILLLSYAVFYTGKVEHSTLNNQQLAITLPDGSTALINAASQLNYNKYTWLINRNVSLSGEGFFKVTKGSQFKVNTSNGNVKVLGTSFNVFSRNSGFNVICFEGKVNVGHKKASTTITPGEKVVLKNGGTLVASHLSKPLHEPIWVNGNFAFENSSLSNVLEEIERQFDVSIEVGKFANELQFTGEWSKSMEVDKVLEVVCLPFGLEITKTQERRYTIKARTL